VVFSVRGENHPNIIEHARNRQALSRTGIPACPDGELQLTGEEQIIFHITFFISHFSLKAKLERFCWVIAGSKGGGQTGMFVLHNGGEFFEVVDEAAMLEAPGLIIRGAQN
jgi:hypothetical protein